MTVARRHELVRVALRLSGGRATSPETVALPVAAWETCCRSAAVLAEVQRRGWRAAEQECRARLRRLLEDLRIHLDAALYELYRMPAVRTATAREIYDDLCALEREFAALRVDLKQREIAVVTEPITLEGVPLGPFEIVLDGSAAQGPWDYRVVALDPNPAAGESDVTHPHVRDDQLCAGEGQGAIRQALAGGRLFDFFTIVAQTLATYNGGGAFVPLRRWSGVACRLCGDVSDEDDASSCQRCGCDLCDDCGAACGCCGNWCCLDCTAECPACGDSIVCGACARRCETCRQTCCQECLHDDVCPACRQAAEESDDDESAKPGVEPPAAESAALADGVGQAGVSA